MSLLSIGASVPRGSIATNAVLSVSGMEKFWLDFMAEFNPMVSFMP
jgi:hypothetical protein